MKKLKKGLLGFLFLFSFVFLFPKNTLAATSVTSLSSSATSVPRYSKLELTFQISRSFDSGSFLPYYYYDTSDPVGKDGISIDAHFVAPSGKSLVVPAFYYQQYDRSGDTMTPQNNFSWKVRFAPEEVGTYTYYLTITDSSGSSRYPASGTQSFSSTASSSKGFVRASPRDSRFLEFEDGESFIPNTVGHQWMRPGRTTSYQNAFADFKTYGINMLRIWDQNDGYGLTVEGHYDAYSFPGDFNPIDNGINDSSIPKGSQMNQRGNAEEDFIIDTAAADGVYIQLCSHGDPYWIWNPTNNDESGIPRVNMDDPAHIREWQRNFRYRVARWGYSTAIVAWETWNEHPNINVGDTYYNFYQTYGAYQKATDPYHHLRTTSQGSQSWSPAFWGSDAFDLANYHDYMMPGSGREGGISAVDAANYVTNFAQCMRMNTAGSGCNTGGGAGQSWNGSSKPIIWGELDSGSTAWNVANPQPKATHTDRWAGLFSPIGMAPIEWYFDQQSASFIQTKYKEAKIASDFFKGVDYAGKHFTYMYTADVALGNTTVINATGNLRVLAMKAQSNAEAYAWVQNKADSDWSQGSNTSQTSGNFTLTGMNNGTYSIEIWDTYTGNITKSSVTASGGNLSVPISGLTKDVAVKILSGNASSTPSPTPKPGDANNDGRIDGIDYTVWLNNYGKNVAGALVGDFNNNGVVDGIDYTVWLNNYGK